MRDKTGVRCAIILITFCSELPHILTLSSFISVLTGLGREGGEVISVALSVCQSGSSPQCWVYPCCSWVSWVSWCQVISITYHSSPSLLHTMGSSSAPAIRLIIKLRTGISQGSVSTDHHQPPTHQPFITNNIHSSCYNIKVTLKQSQLSVFIQH